MISVFVIFWMFGNIIVVGKNIEYYNVFYLFVFIMVRVVYICSVI